jgi:exonuclease SbcC
MIPVSLTIKGLYSYQKEQKIDFEKLLEGQLFGIFGAVGSGKSSILEAISYALYGETERLNKTDYRSYNMMNLKSDDLLIDFVFRNHDNINYRFIVRGKRNPKNFEKVNTLERTAYKQSDGGWIPLESASGEDIIGLSYDNFRRTIIIPQGKFQEFLQLKEKDRTDMLKEIFSLDRFDFYFQTAALEKKNSHAMLDLQGQLKMYADLFPEIIQEQEQEVGLLKAALQNLKATLEDREKLLKEKTTVQQLFNDYHTAEKNLEEIKFLEPKFQQIEKQVKNYEYCYSHFHDQLEREQKISTTLNLRRTQQQDLTKELNNTNNTLNNKELSFNEISKHHDQLDDYKEQMNDLELMLKIFQLNKVTADLSLRIKKGEAVVEDSFLIKENLKKRAELLTQEIRQMKNEMPDLMQLAEIKAWYNGKTYHLDTLNKSEQQLSFQLEQAGLLKQEIKALQETINPEIAPDLIALENHLLAENNRVLAAQEQTYHLIRHYEVQAKMADFSNSLSEGQACPLCGSNHHPNVLVAEDVMDHLRQANLELNNYKSEINTLHSNTQKLTILKVKEKNINQQITEVEAALSQNKEKYENYLATFSWLAFKETTEDEIAVLLNDAQQLGGLITAKEKLLEEEQVKHHQAEEAYQKYKTAIDKIQADLSAKQSQIDILKNQLKRLQIDVFNENTAEIKFNEIKEFVIRIQKEYKELKESIEKARYDKAVLSEKINGITDRIKEEEIALTDISDYLNKAIINSDYKDINEVSVVLNQQLDIEDLKTKIKNFQQQLYSSGEIYNQLKIQVADKEYNTEEFEKLQQEFENLNGEFKIKNDELVRAAVKLAEQQKNYQAKLVLEKQLNELELRAADIALIKNMFKANGFISYISTVYLNQLCEAANERFYKLSRQQLKLEITDKNNFEVRDFLNDGRVRSVKTLSGGQTFQASLSLALALAESVQHQNNAQQNFFFLDEGFGSLDKESLQTALETLKSLRKENRIVGVISHVEELQQEIDVFLTVANDSAEGSQVKGNWE